MPLLHTLSRIDPLSQLLTNVVVSAVVMLVLLFSRLGMREAATGMRTWVLGDLALLAARLLVIVGATVPQAAPGRWAVLGPGSCVVAGLLLHLLVLRRLTGPQTRAGVVSTLAPVLLAMLGFAAVAASITPNSRLLLLCVCAAALLALSLRQLWALRSYWGARLLALMAAISLLNALQHGARLALALVNGEAPAALPPLVLAGPELLMQLVVDQVVSAGFLLLQQERLRARIERLMVTDALTGALNRHGLVEPLRAALAEATRRGQPLSVVLFDLDHFKRVNDQHGHAVGDAVLVAFAAQAQTLLRGGDLFGRWGGEEFLLVLPNTALAAAAQVAERIRDHVASAPMADGVPVVTVSGGAAAASEASAHAEALVRVLQLADLRLYAAKTQRNRVVAEGGVPA